MAFLRSLAITIRDSPCTDSLLAAILLQPTVIQLGDHWVSLAYANSRHQYYRFHGCTGIYRRLALYTCVGGG